MASSSQIEPALIDAGCTLTPDRFGGVAIAFEFGAPPAEWDALLATCRDVGLDVAGFSFHVGSGCGDLKPFADAVGSAREAFDLAAARAYGRVLAAVVSHGRSVRGRRAVDLMVAATALATGLPLYTLDPDDVRGLEGLVDVVTLSG